MNEFEKYFLQHAQFSNLGNIWSRDAFRPIAGKQKIFAGLERQQSEDNSQ